MSPQATTLWLDSGERLWTIDQTLLPFQRTELCLDSMAACVHAIRTMQVRGAPLIGVVAAFGLALALRNAADDVSLKRAYDELLATRPTAVNLRWALDQVQAAVEYLPTTQRAQRAWQVAQALRADDISCNLSIGEHGMRAFAAQLDRARREQRPLQVLTHCNAGALAAVAWGTALAPLFLLAQQGVALHVWVDETRPRNQGASLTAWELAQAGIAHTVIADNAGGLLMMRGRVDLVIVGTDRVTANGDVCNKIGTYLKALAAAAHGVPFFVACPRSTIDLTLAHGGLVPIEERSAREVSHLRGLSASGEVIEVCLIPEGSACSNPAFDITPAALVTALITERGICSADVTAIAALCAEGEPR